MTFLYLFKEVIVINNIIAHIHDESRKHYIKAIYK
jgi:hypothetical protein